MAILLDLPNELLLKILDSATPIGMVSLATSCKRINTLAQDNLTLHRQRIARYQNVTLWGCSRHRDQPHPILLLRDICNDWRVAYYARSLAIECCGREELWLGPYWNDAWRARVISQDIETVKSVLPEITIPVRRMLSMALRWDEAKVNEVLDMTELGARGAILGLLIVSLPAIKSISFKGYFWCDHLWIDSLKSITEQQDPQSGSSEANFLTDVSELNLDDENERHFGGMCCSVVPFVTLPSLRVIRGASINCQSFEDHPFAGNRGLHPSPVTEIDLQRTTLPASHLGNVLRYVQVLKRFRYDRGHQPVIVDGAEPGGIIKALLACASHSLESLALTGATKRRSPNDKDFKGSLWSFKVLKKIHLPLNAFLTYTKKCHCWSLTTEDIPRLVDVLPASIETVRLDGKVDWEEMAALLIGLPEGKAECLPKLKEIVFTVIWDQEEAHKRCAKAWAHLHQKQGMVFQLDKAVEAAPSYSGRFVF